MRTLALVSASIAALLSASACSTPSGPNPYGESASEGFGPDSADGNSDEDEDGDGDTGADEGDAGSDGGDEGDGDTGDGDGDGEDEDGGEESGDGDGDSDEPIWDVAPQGDFPEDSCPEDCYPAVGDDIDDSGDWLLHLSGKDMMRVDLNTGETNLLCELDSAGNGFKSLTFTRDNRLFASDGNKLYEIDPCECTTHEIGSFSHNGIYGITPAGDEDLFGISANTDQLVRIDPNTAQSVAVGPLGVDFYTHGATYSDDEETIYAVRGGSGELYDVNPDTGNAELLATLSVPFGTVGLELHPESDVIYGCSTNAMLYEIDRQTGVCTEIGHMGVNNCTNLGAPWQDGGGVCLPQ